MYKLMSILPFQPSIIFNKMGSGEGLASHISNILILILILYIRPYSNFWWK